MTGAVSRRRDCHCTDITSPPLLKRLLKGGCQQNDRALADGAGAVDMDGDDDAVDEHGNPGAAERHSQPDHPPPPKLLEPPQSALPEAESPSQGTLGMSGNGEGEDERPVWV